MKSAAVCGTLGLYACPTCLSVLALRAWEALEREETKPPLDIERMDRCPDCAFCYGRHAPDCREPALRTYYAQLGIETGE
jgi:hypothetical protein